MEDKGLLRLKCCTGLFVKKFNYVKTEAEKCGYVQFAAKSQERFADF
jgi:hypothetical protein